MKENRVHSAAVRFWISEETSRTIERIAVAEGRTASSVYRDLVEKGLVAGGYRSGEKDLAGVLRTTVDEAMKPQIERLASISAKAAQISAAAFFLAAYNGRQAVPAYLQEEYDEIAAQSRKLGIEYLKLSKDKNLDEFIHRGLGRMGDDNG